VSLFGVKQLCTVSVITFFVCTGIVKTAHNLELAQRKTKGKDPENSIYLQHRRVTFHLKKYLKVF
jgi:hypothetical protein